MLRHEVGWERGRKEKREDGGREVRHVGWTRGGEKIIGKEEEAWKKKTCYELCT